MKKRNKMLALSLTLSSLLLVGCAADQQANLNPSPGETTKVATIANNALPSASINSSKKTAPVSQTVNEAVTSKVENNADTKKDSKKNSKKNTQKDSSKDTTLQLIDEAKAKDLALTHADLTDSDITFVKVKLDHDDGRQVYEVEFYDSSYTEYDYEIDASTGKILDFDRDAEDFVPPVKEEPKSEISKQQAKEIAVSQLPGATTDNICEFEADRDDGRLTYEGSLRYNGVEYEFEIDGSSGKILSWEIDD